MEQVLLVISKHTISHVPSLPEGFSFSNDPAHELVKAQGWTPCEGEHFSIEYQGRVVAHAALAEGHHFGNRRIRLHQVVVDPAYRKLSLGQTLVSHVVVQFDQRPGRYPLYLVTEDKRLPAIRLYTRLGFMPYLGAWEKATSQESEQAWQEITEALRQC